jgi:multimeric flavodoxin WrbA
MDQPVVILKGSPRTNGNSSALADQAAAGAISAGAKVESFILHDLDIRPCDGCDFCRETGMCVVKDDMQTLYPKLTAAGAVVLASPIYWFTYSAQLKTCIDRWYALWNGQPDFFRHKPVGVILTYGDTDVYTSGGINAIHTFETMFRFLQTEAAGWVYGSLSDPGDAQKNPDLMEQAFRLGKKLAEMGAGQP